MLVHIGWSKHLGSVISSMIFIEDELQQGDKCQLRLTLPQKTAYQRTNSLLQDADTSLDISIDHRRAASLSSF